MKNSNQLKNIGILTLGCSKNVVDSENILGLLKANDLNYIRDINLADALIINTCGFIGDAKKESVEAILQACDLKQKGKIKKLIVAGCLSERYKDELQEQISEVDHFFGVSSSKSILKALGIAGNYTASGGRVLLTPNQYAYLKIAEGCNQKCSFCAIPSIRGKYVSYPANKLLDEAEELKNKGVKELIVIAQDTTYYGYESGRSRRLAKLLEDLSRKGFDWIRLMYTYPASFPTEVLDVIAGNENICKYIDLPLQHISDTVLKSMKRGIDRKKIEALLSTVRKKIKGVAIRTSFIVGYPGESDKDFDMLYHFVQNTKFERMGVFVYSHEEGTTAYKLKDSIPSSVKVQRRKALMELQSGISHQRNKSLIGKEIRVIVDEQKAGNFICRTEHDAPDIDNGVIVAATRSLHPGEFLTVKISGCSEYDLLADC